MGHYHVHMGNSSPLSPPSSSIDILHKSKIKNPTPHLLTQTLPSPLAGRGWGWGVMDFCKRSNESLNLINEYLNLINEFIQDKLVLSKHPLVLANDAKLSLKSSKYKGKRSHSSKILTTQDIYKSGWWVNKPNSSATISTNL
jgi:hypothetical protein